jgi:hypothetical protein
MEILGKLFGSEAKTKIIRLFLFNPEASYNARDVSLRTNVKGRQIGSILMTLLNMGLIRKRTLSKEVKRNKKGRSVSKKTKESVYFLDQRFPYASVLSDLMAEASVKVDNRLMAKLMPAGKIKLIIASGIFTRQSDARLDLLIAGDDINEDKLARIIGSLETDIGRDLVYSSLTTADFMYRLDLHDRLIRDVIDFNHIILVDKIGFEDRK